MSIEIEGQGLPHEEPEYSHLFEHQRHLFNRLIILITGSNPGTGASTLASELSRNLNLEMASAGQFRRAMAAHYRIFYHSHHPEHSDEHIWAAFQEEYHQLLNDARTAEGLKKLRDTLMFYVNSTVFSENDLALIRDHQQVFGGSSALFLDQIPDLLTYASLLDHRSDKYGQVLEGKLAVIIEELAKRVLPNPEILPSLEESGALVVKLFLEVTPQVSAQRVLQREIMNGNRLFPGVTKEEMTAWLDNRNCVPQGVSHEEIEAWYKKELTVIQTLNMKRMFQDYGRWSKLYGFDITSHSLQRPTDVITIDAEPEKTDVLREAYERIIGAVTVTLAQPEFSHALLKQLLTKWEDTQS